MFLRFEPATTTGLLGFCLGCFVCTVIVIQKMAFRPGALLRPAGDGARSFNSKLQHLERACLFLPFIKLATAFAGLTQRKSYICDEAQPLFETVGHEKNSTTTTTTTLYYKKNKTKKTSSIQESGARGNSFSVKRQPFLDGSLFCVSSKINLTFSVFIFTIDLSIPVSA